MIEWWESLTGAARVFWSIAIAASVFQILMFLGSIFSTHDFDHSPDGADGDATSGVKLLSVRAIVAFLVGFGWTGGLFLMKGYTLSSTVLAAVVAGLVFMGLIFVIMRGMMSFRDDGTLDFHNTIGLHAQVYVTIPPAKTGRGQVEILVQGRLLTLHAVTENKTALAPQASVKVESVEAGNLLVVSPA